MKTKNRTTSRIFQFSGLITLTTFLLLCATTAALAGDSSKTEKSEKSKKPKTIASIAEGMTRTTGFFNYFWDNSSGKLYLLIPQLEKEFLYVNSLRTGLGSNPVGLDRGQLGRERVVRFVRRANRVFLMQENLDYRAVTDNPDELRAVEESFAKSVLWAGEIVASSGDTALVDLSGFLLRDAHDVIGRLGSSDQGSFSLDKERSVIDAERCKAFPKNTELEVMLTFSSKKPGRLVRETTPTPQAVTLWQRHSFIELPDDNYEMREFDVRAGIFSIEYADYATALDQPLVKRYIIRHRLQKKNPNTEGSEPVGQVEPVEPIVYYVDRGAPEPVRSALIEGASWWNQAFEAAGYKDAFKVEVMPEGADPLDVRYNVIQWVHRSTRGWSYGGSVVDPRTGELIKGHVSLGSLRVRQDRMLVEGLSPLFASDFSEAHSGQSGQSRQSHMCNFGAAPNFDAFAELDPNLGPVDVALMRIRQLSAHEVGHTIGLAHNFAASSYGRESVMDYPAPLAKIVGGEKLDLSEAYDVGIGEWDKIAVRYAYSEFPASSNEDSALGAIIDESIDRKLLFISDADSRSSGSAHPLSSLWDNGADPVKELEHVMNVRKIALASFGMKSIPQGRPLAELENLLVPLYLSHRYQVAATAKSLGGVVYSYNINGDKQKDPKPVDDKTQTKALKVLLETITPKALDLPDRIRELIPPQPYGYYGDKELFPGRTNSVFDPLALAELSARMTVVQLLNHERAARMTYQSDLVHRRLSFGDLLTDLTDRIGKTDWNMKKAPRIYMIRRIVETVIIDELIKLASNPSASVDVLAETESTLSEVLAKINLAHDQAERSLDKGHFHRLSHQIIRFFVRDGTEAKDSKQLKSPPGSPIGQ